MRNKLIFVLAALLTIWLGIALGDDRIDRIPAEWNAGDTLAVQQGFDASAVLSQATLAHEAEQGGTLSFGREVMLSPKLYAVAADVGGRGEVWIFAECADSARWCWWGSHPMPGLIGGAEKGQAADLGSTAIDIGLFGAHEANPLGLALIPIKIGVASWTHYADFGDCVQYRALLDAMGWGAGVGNLAVVAFHFNPAFLVGAVAVGVARYKPAKETAIYECAGYALTRKN